MKLAHALTALVFALAACGSPPATPSSSDHAPILADHVVVLVHGLSCPN